MEDDEHTKKEKRIVGLIVLVVIPVLIALFANRAEDGIGGYLLGLLVMTLVSPMVDEWKRKKWRRNRR